MVYSSTTSLSLNISRNNHDRVNQNQPLVQAVRVKPRRGLQTIGSMFRMQAVIDRQEVLLGGVGLSIKSVSSRYTIKQPLIGRAIDLSTNLCIKDIVFGVGIVFCLLAILCKGFTCSLFAATPQIVDVSGTIRSGSVLTINGQYLMDENKTNWLSPFKSGTAYGFEGSSYTADGYDAAPDEMIHGTRGYDSNVKLSGNKSIYGRVTAATKTGAGFYRELDSTTTDLYLRFYARWHSAGGWKWPESYIKMTMNGGSLSGGLYLEPNYTNGSTLPNQVQMVYNDAPHFHSVSNFLQDNRWYCMEVRYKTSASNNVFTAWIDGVQIDSISNHNSVGNQARFFFGIVNMCCQGSGFDLTQWIDQLAASSSRIYCSSIVEIGNNSNYATATKVHQPLTSLSDASISVTVDLTGLGSGPYYLWVTNNRQERSAGYPLSGGGADVPSAPTGLQVVN